MHWIQRPTTGSLCIYDWQQAYMPLWPCSCVVNWDIKVEQVLKELDTNISDVAIVWYFGLNTCIPEDVLKGLHTSQG